MRTEKARDIVLIICAVVFVLVYSVINLFPFFYSLSYYDSNSADEYESSPSVVSYCDSTTNLAHTVIISVDTYGVDISNVNCELIDKAGLVSSVDNQVIGDLTSGSQDDCIFKLTGNYESPVKVKVTCGEQGKYITQSIACVSAD